jgi:hypothetical protein
MSICIPHSSRIFLLELPTPLLERRPLGLHLRHHVLEGQGPEAVQVHAQVDLELVGEAHVPGVVVAVELDAPPVTPVPGLHGVVAQDQPVSVVVELEQVEHPLEVLFHVGGVVVPPDEVHGLDLQPGEEVLHVLPSPHVPHYPEGVEVPHPLVDPVDQEVVVSRPGLGGDLELLPPLDLGELLGRHDRALAVPHDVVVAEK